MNIIFWKPFSSHSCWGLQAPVSLLHGWGYVAESTLSFFLSNPWMVAMATCQHKGRHLSLTAGQHLPRLTPCLRDPIFTDFWITGVFYKVKQCKQHVHICLHSKATNMSKGGHTSRNKTIYTKGSYVFSYNYSQTALWRDFVYLHP